MAFAKIKKFLYMLMGVVFVTAMLAYKYVREKDQHLNNLYTLHASLVQIYAAPDYLNSNNLADLRRASWDKLKDDKDFMKSLSIISEALPVTYMNHSMPEKEAALLSLHQGYFLKVRQAMLHLRRTYIHLLYDPKYVNPYADYLPIKLYDEKGQDLSFYKSNLQLGDGKLPIKRGVLII